MKIEMKWVPSARALRVAKQVFRYADGSLRCFWFSIGKLQIIIVGIG